MSLNGQMLSVLGASEIEQILPDTSTFYLASRIFAVSSSLYLPHSDSFRTLTNFGTENAKLVAVVVWYWN